MHSGPIQIIAMSTSLEDLVSKYEKGSSESLLSMLQEIQDEMGYLNEEVITRVGEHLNLPASKVYGIATFFDQFRFTPPGRYHIRVCRGTACHLNGSMNVLKEVERLLKISDGQTTRDGFFSLEAVSCIGACSNGPVVNINGSFINAVTTEELAKVLDHYRKKP